MNRFSVEMKESILNIANVSRHTNALAGLSPRAKNAGVCRNISNNIADISCASRKMKHFRRKVRNGPTLSHFTRKSQAQTKISVQAEPNRILSTPLLFPIEIQHHDTEVLKDTFGRFHNYLRISLTERCNLRCVYCMPEDGVELQPPNNLLTTDEIIRIARTFVDLGVNKIRLTGGEPTLRRDLGLIVSKLSSFEGVDMIGITSNGINLSHRIQEYQQAGLTHINVSLDTLDARKFTKITRRKGLKHVLRSIDDALEHGYNGRLKINCVVSRGMNDEELPSFVNLTKDRAVDVRFIEWMPFDSNRWNGSEFISYKEMLDMIQQKYPDILRIQDGPNDTSKWWQVPGHVGRVGFITSMSNHFCGSCNRLRLTADGNLKTCLFGTDEISLRDFIRAGASRNDLISIISHSISKKNFAHGGHKDMYGIAASENRPMILIGG